MFMNTQGSGAATSYSFGATAIAVEIINDDATINIAVRFDGSAAAIPSNSSSLSQSHLIRPKEARYFPISVSGFSIISASGTPQFRATGYI